MNPKIREPRTFPPNRPAGKSPHPQGNGTLKNRSYVIDPRKKASRRAIIEAETRTLQPHNSQIPIRISPPQRTWWRSVRSPSVFAYSVSPSRGAPHFEMLAQMKMDATRRRASPAGVILLKLGNPGMYRIDSTPISSFRPNLRGRQRRSPDNPGMNLSDCDFQRSDLNRRSTTSDREKRGRVSGAGVAPLLWLERLFPLSRTLRARASLECRPASHPSTRHPV